MRIRKHISVIATIILCVMIVACSGEQSRDQLEEQEKQVPAKTTPEQAKSDSQPIATIFIYRYDDFPEAKAEQLKNELQKVYPLVILVKTSIPLPKECYYKPRDRYKGTGLLDNLMSLLISDSTLANQSFYAVLHGSLNQDAKMVGVVTEDIESTTSGNDARTVFCYTLQNFRFRLEDFVRNQEVGHVDGSPYI